MVVGRMQPILSIGEHLLRAQERELRMAAGCREGPSPEALAGLLEARREVDRLAKQYSDATWPS